MNRLPNGKRRHQPTKAELIARMHRGLRPRLDAAQLRDLSMCHHQNFDAITRADPPAQILWDYAESVFAWWKVAQLLGEGLPEMDTQLEVAARLCERWQRTGAVRFDGTDLQLARDGLVVMDLLAERVDRPTAVTACEWSMHEINKLQAASAAYRAQQQPERRAA